MVDQKISLSYHSSSPKTTDYHCFDLSEFLYCMATLGMLVWGKTTRQLSAKMHRKTQFAGLIMENSDTSVELAFDAGIIVSSFP